MRLWGVLATIMIVTGCIWVAMNYNYTPLYGDTTEYIALSKTLKVDQYRGVIYPWAIHASEQISFHLNINNGLTAVLYAVQLVLLFLSSIFFCFSLYEKFAHGQLTKWHVIACAFAGSFNPLSMHFGLTVLTDSASASLVLLQAACLIKATGRNLPLKNFSAWLATAGLITILLSNVRIEKTYLSALAFIVLGVWVFFDSKKNTRIKKIALLIVVFVVTFLASSLIRSATTVDNPNRPNLSVSSQVFNRTVWPRLSKTLPYLPDTISETITTEQARYFDSHNNYVFPFQVEVLRDPNKGSAYLNTIAATAIRHFYPEIIGAVLFDFGKYLLPSLAFPLEALGVLPESVATSWTISRASMASPRITIAYLWIGSLFYFVVIGLAIAKFKKAFFLSNNTIGTVVILGTYLIGNSALFALASGMNAHIRFALPTYIMTLNFLLIFTLSTVSQSRDLTLEKTPYIKDS
jgi:hypothetical protein